MIAFVDNLLRRVAARPLAWFLVLFLLASALWLLCGMARYRLERRPETPPPLEGIPYHKLWPGLHLAAGEPEPPFDPLLAQDDTFYQLKHLDDGDGIRTDRDQRLVCSFVTAKGRYGWPRDWVRWEHGIAYDVTEMREPFPRSTLLPVPSFVRWDRVNMFLVEDTDGGSRWWSVTWCWSHMLMWFLGIEAFVGLAVVFAWSFHTVRFTRRLRRGRCVECGYDLRGGAPAGVCPECGRAPPVIERSSGHVRKIGAARTFLLAWALLAVMWAAGGALFPRERELAPLHETLDGIVKASWGRHLGPGERHRARPVVRGLDHGWPISAVLRTRRQMFAWDPGQDPAPEADTTIVPGSRYGWYEFEWISLADDPSIHDAVVFRWRVALAQILALQVPALFLVGLREERTHTSLGALHRLVARLGKRE